MAACSIKKKLRLVWKDHLEETSLPWYYHLEETSTKTVKKTLEPWLHPIGPHLNIGQS